jgi:hypothetical protein
MRDRFQHEQIVFLASSPRSGSTWLSNILSTGLDYTTLFEPLHLDHVRAARDAGFDWRTYRSELDDWESGRSFLETVMRGNVINSWTAREITTASAKTCRGMVIKCVRATRLLPWLSHQFPHIKIIYLTREPAAVIASQLRSKDWQHATRPSVPEFLRHSKSARDLTSQLTDTAEFLAAQWTFDQWIAQRRQNPPWLDIRYEELRSEPLKQIDRISRFLNRPFDLAKAAQKIEVMSRTTTKQSASATDSWKAELSVKQQTQIQYIVAAITAID